MYTRRTNTLPHPGTSPPRGFSLIELVMVMTIISILAAIAVPRYASALSRYRADAAARRVVIDLAYAREYARSISANVSVQFQPVPDNVRLIGVPGMKDPQQEYLTILRESPYMADLVSTTLGAGQTLVFDGYGNPASGVSIVVTVGPETRTVVLDANTGKAAVQ